LSANAKSIHIAQIGIAAPFIAKIPHSSPGA